MKPQKRCVRKRMKKQSRLEFGVLVDVVYPQERAGGPDGLQSLAFDGCDMRRLVFK